MLNPVDWLNYHHLLYFWMAAREGGVTRAAKKLRLAQPTVSEQIKRLEELLGNPLFERKGRTLALTEFGRTIFGYADEIFSLGRELMDAA
ncbi:MAG TPA: LysR family transcriptional regulator, partial [Polyangiaceae bacterium]|nr:LysR family transcriptional regulator [Polyangiaceae bacterium]